MKLHLCRAPVRLYCRCKNTIIHFIIQILKSISDFKTAVVEETQRSTATSPSRKLIFYVSIITQMLVVSAMAATYRSLSINKINILSLSRAGRLYIGTAVTSWAFSVVQSFVVKYVGDIFFDSFHSCLTLFGRRKI